MRYEPRQRQLRLTWKVVVFLCFLAVAMGTLIYHLLQTQEVYGAFHACGFSSEEMRSLEKQSSEVIELEDYLFYGESLALYMDPYDGEEDGIYGKTMELVNICSGKQYNFTIGNTADRQIYLPDLDDGTYEIYLIDSFKRKRVVFASALESDAFQTMRRNGKVKEAVLTADQNVLNEYGGSLDKHYAFLTVKTVTPSVKKADVVLDPYGYYTTIWGGVDTVGSSGNGIVETKEAYEVALEMKEQLESYGLTVVLTRGEEEVVEYYGENCRASKGYQTNANYLIAIGFSSGEGHEGIETYHGVQSSTHLTNDIMYYLLKNYNIEGSSTYTSQTNVKGIFSSYTTQGDDGRSVYDGMPVFRESGGKATLTGQMNAQSKANQMYADVPGMQAIEFDLACVSDKEDVSYYEKNKETIIRGIVEGFVKTLEADGGK